MQDLKQLNKEALSEIIKGFANNGIIFQSEAQFQFNLAWELQQQGWGKAYLEDMKMRVNKSNGKIGKCYTDIVLEQEDGYRIAIELKYKTAKYEDDKNWIYLLNHDAVDQGRYDYLWDVHRIELLAGIGKKIVIDEGREVNVDVLKGCNKGFAVLLTNEKKYWDSNYIKSEEGSQKNDNQFRIGCSTGFLFDKDLDWKKNNGCYPRTVLTKSGDPTFRAQPIHLNKVYSYVWEDYLNTSMPNGKFRFVIIEV